MYRRCGAYVYPDVNATSESIVDESPRRRRLAAPLNSYMFVVYVQGEYLNVSLSV